jgi:hypothetical protein
VTGLPRIPAAKAKRHPPDIVHNVHNIHGPHRNASDRGFESRCFHLSRLRVPGTGQAILEIMWDSYVARSATRNWEDLLHASRAFRRRMRNP